MQRDVCIAQAYDFLQQGFLQDRNMRKQFSDLPKWYFDMDDVSMGIYEVIGSDDLGHVIRTKGTELELLIEQYRREARSIFSTEAHSVE